ncbi:MAG: phage tail tape measure protein, partial [Sphaerochaetaceae bacterium]|nr:phage tail tape measure protein [Sphaerochaetaceae bacterium]
SMLATATTMTADEGATLLAQFANITQMDPSYYSNLASTIVSLGNNYATTEQKITEMSQGIAASASLAGMSEADMVALSAAVTSLGIETQAGATSMSRLISTLMTAVETGDNLNEFAQIANMSAEEFSQAWGNNAVEALQTFVVGLTDTQRNGKSATVALTELGITEARMQRMVLSLANSGDLLNRTLATSSQAWSENTALTAEAELRYATTQSQLTMMQNSYNNLKVAIGDNFTPVLSELYGVATDVLGSVTEFIQKNPVLVKAITTFVAVMGTAVAGITAYIAVAKIATLVSAALTAAIPGVNVIMAVVAGVAALTAGIVALSSATSEEEREVRALTASSREQYQRLQQLNSEYEIAKEQYGETSDEALTLRYEVDELTESYEANKQTLEEFIAKSNALIESHGQIISGYKEATASINDEEQGALALILKLEELSNKTYLTTVEQEQMKAAVDALNESVPGLALNYNDVTDSLNMSIESMKQMVKAQAEQERQAENYRAWVDLTKEELILSQQLAQAQENLRIRREELTKAGYNVDAPLIGWSTDLDDYMDEVEKLEMAYGEAQAALAEMTAQAEEYEAAQKAAAEGGQDISAVMLDISKSAKELADAYKEAYDAALESIQGQYELWDEAASIVATSAGTINSNLESQINYWQQYNDNLAALSERSSDIQGLSDLIASFADGSSDSVNAISGMANASDEDLRSMVANWQKLQEEQKVAAGSLAEIETEFETSMNNLQQELEGAIADMNLSEEAAESAKQTMQGFADGAINMMPTVQSAYRRIAQAAIAAIDAELDIQSPSRVMMEKAEMTWAGYINETKAMEPEVASAMANASMAGVEAFSAEEAQAATLSSQFMRYIRSLWSNNESVAAQSGFSNGGSHIILNLSPSYNISGMSNTSDLTSALREASRDLKDYILEVLEDHEIDMKRRAFA